MPKSSAEQWEIPAGSRWIPTWAAQQAQTWPLPTALWYPQDGKRVQKINGIAKQPSLFGHSLAKRDTCPQILCHTASLLCQTHLTEWSHKIPFSHFAALLP